MTTVQFLILWLVIAVVAGIVIGKAIKTGRGNDE